MSENNMDVRFDLGPANTHTITKVHSINVLNVDGYIGESTEREICYAEMRGKRLRYLEVPT